MLRFADCRRGDIRLTDAARRFAEAGTDERKALLAKHLVAYVPLAAHIRRVLDERATPSGADARFRDELEDHMAEPQAEQTLARHHLAGLASARCFAYDEHSQMFNLDNPK